MIEILQSLSDNQLAVLACIGAVGLSMLFLTVSFHSNAANRNPGQSALSSQNKNPAQLETSDRRAA
mgnify:CR=1 FL=1|jgi:hypothetical protein